MEYSLLTKYELIKEELLKIKSKNPIEIVKVIMEKEYINMHGPEHHFLDGATFMVAYYNAGGVIEIKKALDLLHERTIKMPGAMCGYWGVCGSVTSIGAALSIINETTPLSSNSYYKDNMEYTSEVIKQMREIGGPRCCKRNAFISLSYAISFVRKKYGVEMDNCEIKCDFFAINKQCLKARCPFYK